MILTYHQEGDYLLPDLTDPEASKLGKYGMLRRSYLRKHYYTGLQLSGKLDRHLEEIDQQAKEMMDHLVFQMVKTFGVTEQLKASDQPKRNDEQYPSNGGRNRFEGIGLQLIQ